MSALLTPLITVLALGLGMYPSATFAGAREAASCSPTDVQAAVDAAASGATVVLPSCTYAAWGTTVSITKSITLEGQGTGQTILQRQAGGALIMFQVTGVTGFEMRNLTLAGTYATHPNVYRDMGLGLSNVVDFRIHDVTFQNLARGIEIRGDPTLTRGVIYQNTFTDMYYLEPSGRALGYGVVVYGIGTWPPLALGTSQNVFIEDNTFTRNRHAVASNNGSRYVFRYNTVIDNREHAAAVDAHGWSAWPRGSRQYEIYGNTVNNAVPRYAGVLPRGGDGVIFNNRFSANVTYEVLLTNERSCVGTYPLPDQIRELYIWNNTLLDGVSAPIFVQSGCKSFIQLNRDYFTTQRLGYTPYAYPHPLRVGTPTAPSNLTVTAVSRSWIQLSWTDNSTNELGFKIDRWTGAVWVEIATVGANVTTFQNTGLAASTTYYYQVRAYNAAGSSAAAPWQDATTLVGAVRPAPPNLTLTVVASSLVEEPGLTMGIAW